MNNSTTTETLPKTGHVNEVCKEWLVREDGALAYKLQSQEIKDFYKGNRQRNAVVREDFPTALHEQIKEQETAQKQAEAYRRRLMEQEEHDKRVAKEIADKLERDIQEQQQRELLESEEIALKMQEIYVNMPPVPPPASRDKSKPPPRPAKASTMQQNTATSEQQPTTSNATRYHRQHQAQQQQYQHTTHQTNHFSHHHQQQQQQQQQQQLQYFAETNGYVGLSVNLPSTPQRQKPQTTSNHLLVSAEPSSSSSSSASAKKSSSPFTPVSKAHQQQTFNDQMSRSPLHNHNDNNNSSIAQPQYRQQHLSSSSSISPNSASLTNPNNSAACSPSSSNGGPSMRRTNIFDFINVTAQNSPQNPTQHNSSPKHQINNSNFHTPNSSSPQKLNSSVEELIEYSDVADSIRRYDINASNNDSINNTDMLDSPSKINKLLSPSHENLLSSNEKKFQKLSPDKYDQMMGNPNVASSSSSSGNKINEQGIQQHADDIELYVDPCDYESLKDIGLPLEEIKEMSKKLKQEQKDALLARRLQEMEANDGVSQEERDRMLAIEAQDKELARMLQEREKAKVKRAKEKARLRKSQQQQKDSSCGSSTGLHCGPLLPLPQDCLSTSKQRLPVTSSPPYSIAQRYQPQSTENPIDMEAYSNPIDVLTNQQRQPNGTLTNGSLTRDVARHTNAINNGNHSRDDDIYTLPVDSCRPTTNQRPASLIIGQETLTGQHNSMTRSENYSLDSHGSLNGHHEISPRMNFSKSAVLEQNSSPTPPYMPIQGTRRSNSGEERKKKSKDKCTHQ